jgi:GWxTD domain-containing protein
MNNRIFSRFDDRSISPLVFETIPYFSDDTTYINLIILYRIDPSLLFFSKTNDVQHEIFEAKCEIIAEIFNEQNIAVTRDIKSLIIENNSILVENSIPTGDLQGTFSFKVQKGSYHIIIEIKDNESKRSFVDKDTHIDVRSANRYISPSMFIEPIMSDSVMSDNIKFVPINLGGNIVIGKQGGLSLQYFSPDTVNSIGLNWQISYLNADDEDTLKLLGGEKFFDRIGKPMIISSSMNVHDSITIYSKQSHQIYVPIPLERLEDRTYKFEYSLSQGSFKTKKESVFEVIWPLKPRSLSDINTAVDALRHIAAEKEIDEIRTSSRQRTSIALNNYWRKKYNDTTTAYNPAKAEYYRRVDEAMKRFSTANEFDGYKTDRGRIFILFGSPSFTNRLLRPESAPMEIWTYEKLNERFTFIDQNRSGNYVLIKTETY